MEYDLKINMSRAEKRRADRQKYSFTREELKEFSMRQTSDAIRLTEILMAHALHKRYKFGTKRINEVIKEVYKLSDMLEKGTIDYDDCEQWCNDMKINL